MLRWSNFALRYFAFLQITSVKAMYNSSSGRMQLINNTEQSNNVMIEGGYAGSSSMTRKNIFTDEQKPEIH